MLAAIHVLNRLECIGEALRHALNTLATVAPDWLRAWVPPLWRDRYARRLEDYRLPDGKAERYELAGEIGADGRLLLGRLYAADAPVWLCNKDHIFAAGGPITSPVVGMARA